MDAITTDAPVRTLRLSQLLKRAVVDAGGQDIGRLSDVIVRLGRGGYPAVTGVVADVGRRRLFVPADLILAWTPHRLELLNARLDLRTFERRQGEVLLRLDVLGHRLVDIEHSRFVRAHDVELTHTGEAWQLTGVDLHRAGVVRRRSSHDAHPVRDWHAFEALIGHQPSVYSRTPSGRLRRLKPAQLADLLEEANASEQNEILAHVHNDPELEADVFEELDADRQAEILGQLTDEAAAAILTRMRADDATDAITEQAHDRRQRLLRLLSEPQRAKVMNLLSFNSDTAGGLMGVDYLALSATETVASAIQAIRNTDPSQGQQALTSIYLTDDDQRLCGVVTILDLIRADPTATLTAIADPQPARLAPDADIVEVATRMADNNLLSVPVVDHQQLILGVITVDDLLEAAIPDNWRHRQTTPITASPSPRADSTDAR
jgi:CBS domain-containing protein